MRHTVPERPSGIPERLAREQVALTCPRATVPWALAEKTAAIGQCAFGSQ